MEFTARERGDGRSWIRPHGAAEAREAGAAMLKEGASPSVSITRPGLRAESAKRAALARALSLGRLRARRTSRPETSTAKTARQRVRTDARAHRAHGRAS